MNRLVRVKNMKTNFCFKFIKTKDNFNLNIGKREFANNSALISLKNIFKAIKLNSLLSFRQYSQFNESIIKMSEDVKSALIQNKPIVAFESTIITHGMPFPINLQTAKKVEAIARNKGVIPATIALINGEICVGLDCQQLQFLAQESETKSLVKISRSDLPFVAALKGSGGTTVSATSLIANRCGIDIFVTGGIGGVHRGVDTSFDISADLTELGRTPITVICAGVKSILDIPKTLQFLETQGVCVVVFDGDLHNNRKFEFPAFFSRKSGSQLTNNVKTVEEVAAIILEHKKLGLESGIVIAVPIPQNNQSIGQSVDRAITEALDEVKQKNIIGKEVTPYVLERVNQLSGGSSLAANKALIENNAKIGAEIAIQFQKLRNQSAIPLKRSKSLHKSSKNSKQINNNDNKNYNCFDSSNTDIESSFEPKELNEKNGNQSKELSPVRSDAIIRYIDSETLFCSSNCSAF